MTTATAKAIGKGKGKGKGALITTTAPAPATATATATAPATVTIKKAKVMDIPVKANQATMILTSRLYQKAVDWQALVDRILKAKPGDYSSAVKIVRAELKKVDEQIAANIRYGCTRRLLATLADVKVIGPWSPGQSEINWL